MTANRNLKSSETKTPNISSCKYTIFDIRDKELQALDNFSFLFSLSKTIALSRHVIQTFLFALFFNCLNYSNYLSRFASTSSNGFFTGRFTTFYYCSRLPCKFMLKNGLTKYKSCNDFLQCQRVHCWVHVHFRWFKFNWDRAKSNVNRISSNMNFEFN